MKLVLEFIVRQSGWLAILLLLFAGANGGYVAKGLWQGSGLHGYFVEPGAKGGPPHIVSVGAAFTETLVFLGLACLTLGLKLWHMAKAGSIGIRGKGKAGHTSKRTANQRRR